MLASPRDSLAKGGIIMNIYTILMAIFIFLFGLYGLGFPDLTTRMSNKVRSILGLNIFPKPKITEREHKQVRISSIFAIILAILAILLEINKL